MIVRISGEDQYRLGEQDQARLHQLDGEVLAAVHASDEEAFERAYGELLAFVRANGELLGEDELEGSDLILPPADITLAEVGEEFTGEGLIPS
ncbi:MAG: PspA-associated protein PspAA [Solirubrobacteraceae bacterium]